MAEFDNDVTTDVIDVLPREEIRVCLFSIGEDFYAIPVDVLLEIIIPQKIFPVPTTPPHVLGVINLRGNIVPIVDIRDALGMPPQSTPGQIAIIKHDLVTIGIAVDNVSAVIAMPESSIQAVPAESGSPQTGGKSRSRFVKGIIQGDTGVTALLNIGRILDEIKLS